LLPRGAFSRRHPGRKKRSSSFGWELTIVETDDPRWIDFTKGLVRLSQGADEIAGELVSAPNLSLVGAVALLTYAIEHAGTGYVWPEVMEDGEGTLGSWSSFLHRAVLSTLKGAIAQA
jgi:hypothetical protein